MPQNRDFSALIAAALQARQNAYAPYSHYAVGAAVMTSDGRIFSGCNVENAAYPTGMCAERVALFKAVSEGARHFLAVVVATENGGSPCGSCRQALAEFGLDWQVLMVNSAGVVQQQNTLRELLPLAFTPQHLKIG